MGATMTTIEIEQRTAELLKTKAEASGLSLDDYLRRLAEAEALLHASIQIFNALNDDAKSAILEATKIDGVLDELAQGSEGVAPLPANFSREDIYSDHD
jgi:hypothetical protein